MRKIQQKKIKTAQKKIVDEQYSQAVLDNEKLDNSNYSDRENKTMYGDIDFKYNEGPKMDYETSFPELPEGTRWELRKGKHRFMEISEENYLFSFIAAMEKFKKLSLTRVQETKGNLMAIFSKYFISSKIKHAKHAKPKETKSKIAGLRELKQQVLQLSNTFNKQETVPSNKTTDLEPAEAVDSVEPVEPKIPETHTFSNGAEFKVICFTNVPKPSRVGDIIINSAGQTYGSETNTPVRELVYTKDTVNLKSYK